MYILTHTQSKIIFLSSVHSMFHSHSLSPSSIVKTCHCPPLTITHGGMGVNVVKRTHDTRLFNATVDTSAAIESISRPVVCVGDYIRRNLEHLQFGNNLLARMIITYLTSSRTKVVLQLNKYIFTLSLLR